MSIRSILRKTRPMPAETGPALRAMVRADQLASVRRSVTIAIPVNMMLGAACLVVAYRAGHGALGAVWFACSTVMNLTRLALCRASLPGRQAPERETNRWLAWSAVAAAASGCVWAAIPVLSDGHTAPQTLFYLTVTCGITAGAVTHGTAFARIPVSFITPPLLSCAVVLLVFGGFDRVCLGLTVVLYWLALIRSARQTEAGFCEASRLKYEATTLARSLERAHARSLEVAEEMRVRATHDPLTGLLNRAGFLAEADRLAAEPGTRHAVMLLDLDGFKSVNDAFGHKTGDRVLADVARRIRETVPADAAVARLGGDEFAVMYHPVGKRGPDPDGAPDRLPERLIASMAAPFEFLDTGRLGISIGLHPAGRLPVADMLAGADEALYAAKSAGRNRCRVFDDGLRAKRAMRGDIERDLPRAIAAGTLDVWFQPVFGRGGRTLGSLEALLRWNHPRHGWVPPGDLIATAAMAGLSEPLLRFVLDRVCAMIRMLDASGVTGVWVSMNVSPREMAQLPVDTLVLDRLRDGELPAHALEIELTEETALDLGAVQGRLAALSSAGIRIAVDDFGVGFSSLASLRHLRADRVKIDRSLVTGLADSADHRALIEAVLHLGRSMGFDVVAEGVETADDLRVLRAIGCQTMQGYLLARPMPAKSIADWLERPVTDAA